MQKNCIMQKMLRLYDCGAKLLLRFKPSARKDLETIYIELYINRLEFFRQTTKLQWYKTHIYSGRVLPRSIDDAEFLILEKKLNEKIRIWDTLLSQMRPISLSVFIELLQNPVKKSLQSLDFYGFAWQFFSQKKPNTKKIYESLLNNLQKHYPDGSWLFWKNLEAIDLTNYFFGRTLKNYVVLIKIVFNEALKQGILVQNPVFFRTIPKISFRKIIFERKKTDYDRCFEIWASCENKKRVSLAKFLFAALTGLRWVDVNNLSPDNLCDGRLVVVLEKTKNSTGAAVNMELSDKALQLLSSLATKETDGQLKYEWHYKCISSDYYNLRFFELGFSPKFHDSRRFVATEISKKTGGDIFKIGKILGVTPTTAQKYVYMDNSDVDVLTKEGFF